MNEFFRPNHPARPRIQETMPEESDGTQNTSETVGKGANEKKRRDKKRGLAKYLVLSAFLHIFGIAGANKDMRQDLEQEAVNTYVKVERGLRRAIGENNPEEYRRAVAEFLKNNDQGDDTNKDSLVVHLGYEQITRGLSKEEVKNAAEAFERIVKYLDNFRDELRKNISKKENADDVDVVDNDKDGADTMLRVFHEMIQRYKGRYVPESALVSDLINKKQGNCDARAILWSYVLAKLYPGMSTKLLWHQNHIEAVVEVNSVWYVLRDTPERVTNEELNGRVIMDQGAFLEVIAGDRKVNARAIPDPDNKPDPNLNLITNSPIAGMLSEATGGAVPSRNYNGSAESKEENAQTPYVPFEATQSERANPEEMDIEIEFIDSPANTHERGVEANTVILKPTEQQIIEAKLTGIFNFNRHGSAKKAKQRFTLDVSVLADVPLFKLSIYGELDVDFAQLRKGIETLKELRLSNASIKNGYLLEKASNLSLFSIRNSEFEDGFGFARNKSFSIFDVENTRNNGYKWDYSPLTKAISIGWLSLYDQHLGDNSFFSVADMVSILIPNLPLDLSFALHMRNPKLKRSDGVRIGVVGVNARDVIGVRLRADPNGILSLDGKRYSVSSL
ncbi:MAG: hypothetical protein UX39_C0010G0019 [Candidatus Magasanikbacteria bacterium GW2011_GWA2_46_17]|uniref:Uncharacterized protein n=1 Tax=Candidatus Magasanikbacteria bacterium GW2011_GWA2_46_17 TaxID=1619042 RepID=A0A0G1P115_9BACT|nr:MAG: hypothetical protein UX39_C0010G0019 [Candidatus Magasanikbacteria bacterium GW2011_GWA2_46_17]